MSGFWKLFLGISILVIMVVFGVLVAQAEPAAIKQGTPPEGFRMLKEAVGVRLFQKDYKNGSPDFVQVVSLNAGAAVELLHGPVTQARAGKGAYGGQDARIQSLSLGNFWKNLTKKNDDLFCVTNGQFFYMPESPTRLSLPLKVDGEVITDGYAANEFVGKKLMLELWQDHADIRELSGEALYSSTAPNIVGGLTADANKRIKRAVGRTFAGVGDWNRDGLYEAVLIFNTRTAYQQDAEAVLKSFGAEKVMMLDGGGSTQLFCQGQPIIYSERLIPQAIAVIAGSGNLAANTSQADPALNSLETIAEEPNLKTNNSDDQPIPIPSPTPLVVDNLESESVSQSRINDMIWIPALLLPVGLFVFFLSSRIRRLN